MSADRRVKRKRYLSKREVDPENRVEVASRSRKRWDTSPEMESDYSLSELKSPEKAKIPGKLPFGAKSNNADSSSERSSPKRAPKARKRLEALSQVPGRNTQVPSSDSQVASPTRSPQRSPLRDRRGDEMSRSSPTLSKTSSKVNLFKPVEEEQQQKKLTSGKLDDTLRRLDWQQKQYLKKKNRHAALVLD